MTTKIKVKKNHHLTNEEIQSILNLAFGDCIGFHSTEKHDVFEMSRYVEFELGMQILMKMIKVKSIIIDNKLITLLTDDDKK